MNIQFTPIGYFSCDHPYPQQVPRQATLAQPLQEATIELTEGLNFEQALQDLQGFTKIWLIYIFDRNINWKPKVRPPRGTHKRGVFATRAPYRPNPIGLSCVTLISVKGRLLTVKDFDLLDKTPILDIKPYLPYADSFPTASCGWLPDESGGEYVLAFLPLAQKKASWIKEIADFDITSFIYSQLTENPTDESRKRIKVLDKNKSLYEISARTWRINFSIDKDTVTICDLHSGYTPQELASTVDTYQDKRHHIEFNNVF